MIMESLEKKIDLGRGREETYLLMEDFNARVDRRQNEVERFLEPFGEMVRNREGDMLLNFCLRNDLKIMNGFYQKKDS